MLISYVFGVTIGLKEEILLEFCVEPIFADMPWLFVCFCLSNGALVGINQTLEMRKAEQEVFIRASRN